MFLEGVAGLAGQAGELIFAFLAAQDSVAAFTAAEIDREIGGDAIEPGREARAGFEFGQILIGADERFLSQFEGIIGVVDDGHGDADHSPLIALDQRAEGLRVTAARPLDELGLVGHWARWFTQMG